MTEQEKQDRYIKVCEDYNKLRREYGYEFTIEKLAEKWDLSYHYMRRLIIKAFQETGRERYKRRERSK